MSSKNLQEYQAAGCLWLLAVFFIGFATGVLFCYVG